ncbi:MAG: caspase family protein [Clostridia bacterium]|nr:caspase family protein [Clostridia bacterium]
MKKLLALFICLTLLTAALPAFAEEEGLLDDLFSGIEAFDEDSEDTLALPLTPDEMVELLQETGEKDGSTLDVSRLYSYGITHEQLLTSEYYTYLPAAGMVLAICNYRGFEPEDHLLSVRVYKYASNKQLMLIMFDYSATTPEVYLGYWTPGQDTMTGGKLSMTVAEFQERYASLYSASTYCPSNKLADYYTQLRQTSDTPLTVGKATFSISTDRQHIFIQRPTVSGGSGSYTIAYNIYDSDSQPVNYFYSAEASVAATPGYGGLFNVFVVVRDTVSGEENTQNIGWQQLSWPYASQLTVGALSYEISEDRMSIYLNRPAISCRGGSVSIAYNIYDANSQPVNYFYSSLPRVAATPGYAGKFNVYVVVTDLVTKESKTQNIGWVTLGGTNGAMYRALLVGNSTYRVNSNLPCSAVDVKNMNNLLSQVNGGAYKGHITVLENSTTSTLRSAITSTYNGAKSGDVSLFYVSAHGITNYTTGEYAGAVVMSDETLVTWKNLAAWLSSANPNNKVIVLIDTCGSGAPVVQAGESDFDETLYNRAIISAFAAADPGIKVKGADKTGELRSSKFEVITASNNGETSYGFSTGSNFTNYIVAGIGTLGSMPADSNSDGYVTTNELYTYTYGKCTHATNPQHPQVWPIASTYQLFWR